MRGGALLLAGRPTTHDSSVATFGRRRSGSSSCADPVGREPSDAATVWKHSAADRCAALADRIARGGGEVNRSQEGGGGEVCEKSLEMRHFGVLPYPEEGELAHSWAPGGGRDAKDEKTAPTEVIGSILAGGWDGKNGILAERSGLMAAHQYWPLVNTDERGYIDSPTGSVPG